MISDTLAQHIPDLWRLFPDLFASKVGRGRWQPYKYLKIISQEILQALHTKSEQTQILLIEAPPRHGKSEFLSYYLPAWFLNLYPEKNIIHASYSAELSSGFGRRVRNLVIDNQDILNFSLSEDSRSITRWHTDRGGAMFTSGVGGTLTGRGFHLGLIDDPVKNWEEASSELIQQRNKDWFETTFFTRAEPGALIVCLMTRWHENDLAGFLLSKEDWNVRHIRFPAIAEEGDVLGRQPGDALCPERYSIEKLRDIQKRMSPMHFASLYQQTPVNQSGNFFQINMFEFGKLPEKFDYAFITADTSYKEKQENDFTVFTAFGVKDGNLYVRDVWRRRVKASEIENPAEIFIRKHLGYGYRGTYIEPKGHGIYLNQKLAHKGLLIPSERQLKEFYSDRKYDKVERANNVIPYLSDKKVIINELIPIKEELMTEILAFPKGKHDDFVDTLIDGLKMTFARQVSILDVL